LASVYKQRHAEDQETLQLTDFRHSQRSNRGPKFPDMLGRFSYYRPPKRCSIFINLHGVTFRKTRIFNTSAVSTVDPYLNKAGFKPMI